MIGYLIGKSLALKSEKDFSIGLCKYFKTPIGRLIIYLVESEPLSGVRKYDLLNC